MHSTNVFAIGLLMIACAFRWSGAFCPVARMPGSVVRGDVLLLRPAGSSMARAGGNFVALQSRSSSRLAICMAAKAGSPKKKAADSAPAPEVKEEPKVKRPLTAYFLFAGAKRQGVKKLHPGMANTEIVKTLAEMWRNASPADRKLFQDQAAAAKKEFDAIYGKPAKKKDEGPKKPLSAYMYYAADVRPKVKQANPAATFGEIAKIIGKQWGELPDDQKKKYQEKQAKEKAAWDALYPPPAKK